MGILGKRLLLIASLIAFGSGAQAFTTYTTLGEPGDTYATGSGWLVNGSANPPQPFVGEAFAFTATGSGKLDHLRIAISAGSTNLAIDLANISIALNNSGNLPGAALESFPNVPCPDIFGLNNPLTTLTSTIKPLLQSGVTYWICVVPALPSAAIVVNQNSLGLLANQAQEFSPSAWSAKGSKTTFAFDVDVTQVPEPSTTALAALGISALILPMARRFRFTS